jgi:hypothetical protein
MMNNIAFWRLRYEQQLQYIREIADRTYTWSGRKQQVLQSALEVLSIIEEKCR